MEIITTIGFVVLIKVVYDGIERVCNILSNIYNCVYESQGDIEEIKSHTAYFKTFGKFK